MLNELRAITISDMANVEIVFFGIMLFSDEMWEIELILKSVCTIDYKCHSTS